MSKVSITPIVCSECSKGRYAPISPRNLYAECDFCGHVVHITTDVENVLDEGESLVFNLSGFLSVASVATEDAALQAAREFLWDAGHHTQKVFSAEASWVWGRVEREFDGGVAAFLSSITATEED